jgi:cell division protein FtsW (lipid II flippase)
MSSKMKTASYIGLMLVPMLALLYYTKKLTTDEVVWVLLVVVAILSLIVAQLQGLIEKHQKALRWFADHVYETPKGLKEAIPEELGDLVKPN